MFVSVVHMLCWDAICVLQMPPSAQGVSQLVKQQVKAQSMTNLLAEIMVIPWTE